MSEKGWLNTIFKSFHFFFYLISSSSTAPKGETNGFQGNVSIKNSSSGAAFLFTTAARGDEGAEKRVLGFLSFRFLRRNSLVQQLWLWRKHLWLWACY